MSSKPYMIDDSAKSQGADVWFALPPGFVPLPLNELMTAAHHPPTAGRPGDALWPMLAACVDRASRQRLLRELGPVLRMAQLLVVDGCTHCCLGLHVNDVGDGGLLPSLFTLCWRATSWSPRSVLAARSAASIEHADHVEMLELPCGPASLVQTRLTGPTDLGLARQLVQITVHVPCPDGLRIAIATLASTAVEQARPYRALLRGIAATISFESPFVDMTDDLPDKE